MPVSCQHGRVIDYTALTAPAHPAEVRGFTQWARNSGMPWAPLPRVTYRVTEALGVLAGFIILPVVVCAVIVVVSLGQHVAPPLLVFPFALIFIGIGVYVLHTKTRTRFAGVDWSTMYRLHAFAEGNGLEYAAPPANRAQYPGRLFDAGSETYNRIFATTGRFFEIGSVRRVIGTHGDVPLHAHSGYVAVRLDRALPQITLESPANRGRYDTITIGAPGGTLSLEGDFDDHFTLRCPPGYERDALYLLTPDLMTLLIDETHMYDVELIDEWMFVYSPEPFVAADAATYKRLFQILATMGAKAVERSSRYSDPRRPARGARLFGTSPAWVQMVFWAAVACFAVTTVVGIFSALS
jgi:hypothetical protein